jgi:O-antigen/teichoic acid export membrane protein
MAIPPSSRVEFERAWPHLISLQAGQGVALATGAAAIAIASRALGPTDYGLLTLFLAITQYAVIVSVNWTSAAVVRFGRAEFATSGSVHRVFWTRLALVGSSVGLVIVTMGFAHRLIESWTGLSRLEVVLAIVTIAAVAMSDHNDGILQAIGRWHQYAWLAAVEKISFLGGLVAIVLLLDQRSLRPALITVAVSQIVRVVIGGTAILKAGVATPIQADRETARRIVDYSWPHLFTFTVGYFSAFAEPFLIQKYLAVQELGVYQVSYQISVFSALLLSPVSTLLFPAVTSLRATNREDLTARLLRRLVPQFVFLVNVAIVLEMSLSTVLFRPIFGDAFAGGLPALLILLAGVSFQTITICYSPILAAFDRTKELAALNTIGGLLFHLVPQIVLISMYGIAGAAAAWLLWYMCSATVCVSVIKMRIPAASLSILLYPAIALAAMATLLTIRHPAFQVLLLVGILGAAVAWARRYELFQEADVVALDMMGVPDPVRRFAAKALPLFRRTRSGAA